MASLPIPPEMWAVVVAAVAAAIEMGAEAVETEVAVVVVEAAAAAAEAEAVVVLQMLDSVLKPLVEVAAEMQAPEVHQLAPGLRYRSLIQPAVLELDTTYACQWIDDCGDMKLPKFSFFLFSVGGKTRSFHVPAWLSFKSPLIFFLRFQFFSRSQLITGSFKLEDVTPPYDPPSPAA